MSSLNDSFTQAEIDSEWSKNVIAWSAEQYADPEAMTERRYSLDRKPFFDAILRLERRVQEWPLDIDLPPRPDTFDPDWRDDG